MSDDVEDGRDGAFFGAQAKTHVDVADLRRGGEGDHAVDVVLFNGTEGADDHGDDAEDKDDVGDACLNENIKANDAVDHFDEYHDVGFGDQAGEDRAGAGGGGAVGVGHPEMEGEAAALDGQTQSDQRGGYDQGYHVGAAGGDVADLLFDVGDQQVTGDVIQQDDADEEQTGAQQAEDHIARGGGGGASDLTDHQQTAGGQRRDFDEYIGGEYVVGVEQRQQGNLNQIYQGEVEVSLAFTDVVYQLVVAAVDGQVQDQAEGEGQQGLQGAHLNFVAPGRRKVAHHEDEGLAGAHGVDQNHKGEAGDHQTHDAVKAFGPLGTYNRADDRGEQRHDDGKQRDAVNDVHCLSPPFWGASAGCDAAARAGAVVVLALCAVGASCGAVSS